MTRGSAPHMGVTSSCLASARTIDHLCRAVPIIIPTVIDY